MYLSNHFKRKVAGGSAVTQESDFFGDGAGGDVTISANTTITSNHTNLKYYENFTIDSTKIVTTGRTAISSPPSETNVASSWCIFVMNTFTNNGTITADAQGAPGGAAISNPTQTGNTGRSGQGVGGNGGDGGDGGSSGGGGTIAGGTTTTTNANELYILPTAVFWRNPISFNTSYGSGGSGGSRENVGSTQVSGAGGTGGGEIVIIAKNVVQDGVIQSNGGNGTAAVAGGAGAGAGGGGGGGGGSIRILYETYFATGSYSVAGGSGGAGTADGAAGTSGTSGSTILQSVLLP